jgi:group II intron reverse transcriptase/maturase
MTANNTIRRLKNDLGKGFFGVAHAKYQGKKNGMDRLSAQALDPHRILRIAKEELFRRKSMSAHREPDKQVLHWFDYTLIEIHSSLMNGTFRAKCPKIYQIPKSNGGTRTISVFSFTDSVVQKTLEEVLGMHVNPKLHRRSTAYRPGSSTTRAVKTVESLIEQDYLVTINIDIEKCFDNIDHELLWGRLSAAVQGDSIAQLTQSALEFGDSPNIPGNTRRVGISQGSPLSPLLVNIYLDNFDRALTSIGAEFVRHSDNVAVLAKSRSEASKLLDKTVQFMAENRLKFHPDGLKVQTVWETEFLGYRFVSRPDKSVKVALSEKTKLHIRDRIEEKLQSSLAAPLDMRIAKQDLFRSELPLVRYLAGLPGSYGVSHDWKALQSAITDAKDCATNAGYSGWIDGEITNQIRAQYERLHVKFRSEPL